MEIFKNAFWGMFGITVAYILVGRLLSALAAGCIGLIFASISLYLYWRQNGQYKETP